MILLDTHALVWLIEGDRKLGESTRRLIDQARAEDGALFSVVSAWEIALFTRSGRIGLSLDTRDWINLVLTMPGFVSVPLKPMVAVDAVTLDWHHRDPADRFLVATAVARDLPLVTADENILAYAAAGHVKAIDARR